jgi:hypothetical protein
MTMGLAHAADDVIWIEGEAAKSNTMTKHGWYGDVKKGLLSGGAWLSSFGGRVGIAEYDLDAPSEGDYTFWVRANPIAASLSYKLAGDWVKIDLGKDQYENTNIAANNAPDMRFIAWVKVGTVKLAKGRQAISFRMDSANGNHGGLDCFLFTKGRFTPNGAVKPGQKLGSADPGMWAFEPDEDEFSAKALLDLRPLNEKVAGEHGWVTMTKDGDFALGDGRPVRFWGICSGVQNEFSLADTRTHLRFMAKRGVNMVRYHASLEPKGDTMMAVDEKTLDATFKLVAAAKENGVYVTYNPYWATTNAIKPGWGIPGHPGGAPFGLVYWDETLQQGYKFWLKELFTRKNPYTGIPLSQDPTFALFIIQNEDSMFFWTIQQVKGEELRRLGKRFGAFLAKKYGSLDKAQEAWKGVPGANFNDLKDDWGSGAIGFMGMWEFGLGQTGPKAVRLGDQMEFFAETERAFDTMVESYIHDELKSKCLVCAGNWRTANQLTLLDAMRYAYTANEVIGANIYTSGGAHVNPTEGHKAGYLVSKGDFFEDDSNLLKPRRIPTNRKQVAGHAMIIPESTWVPPYTWQSEAPFLISAYASLTGVDCYYWFSTGSIGWDKSIGKWQFAEPDMLGGFPAAALMFRKGYVRKGEPVVHEERALKDIWGLKSTLLGEEEAFDPNRDAGAFPSESKVKTAAHPLAYLVGPVEAVYGGDPAKSTMVDFSRYIDEGTKTVTSITGEVKLNYGDGWCTVASAKVAGATGFLAKAGRIDLGAVTILSGNEYATVMVVPLDEKELKDSAQVLVQTTTVSQPYGWRTSPATFNDGERKNIAGKRIDDTGSVPWNIVKADVTVTVKNPGLRKATVLDANGMAVQDIAGVNQGGIFTVKLPENALYVVLGR